MKKSLTRDKTEAEPEEEPEVPLHEVTQASVGRMDGVIGPTNGIPFLLMRATKDKAEEGETKRYGKTISSATEKRLRESIGVINELLGDTNQTADEPGDVDDDNLNKAGDAKEASMGNDTKEVQAPEQTVTREQLEAKVKELENENKVLREQAPRVGSMNAPSMGATGGGGSVNVANLDASSGDGNVGTAGPNADLRKPEQNVVDGEASMGQAVAKTAANVKLATSEEESPDIGQQIARSVADGIKKALEEGLKPLQEQLTKIAAEDSRGQQKPFVRGAGPSQDYHLVRRSDGGSEITSDSEVIRRALDKLDPVERDQVSRGLALASHPLMANKQ